MLFLRGYILRLLYSTYESLATVMFLILLYKAQHSYTPKKLTLFSYIGYTQLFLLIFLGLKSTVLHTTVHYRTVLYSTTLPLLHFSSFLLTSSLLACSSLSISEDERESEHAKNGARFNLQTSWRDLQTSPW